MAGASTSCLGRGYAVASDELGFEFADAAHWFREERSTPYVLVRVDEEHARSWAELLGVPVRRCYVSDDVVRDMATASGASMDALIGARLPDPGSTMAGDFGEILVYFYQAAVALPDNAIGALKWRLKQDRTKPAPHSDVVQFIVPSWPIPSDQDTILCSEVKTKSTNGDSTPIKSAIEDSSKDRTSRLARTLVWLRERALYERVGDASIEHIDRFINATDYPPSHKHFRAVAVICSSIVENELADAPPETSPDYTLVVIVVPNLPATYAAVFDAARRATPEQLEADTVP